MSLFSQLPHHSLHIILPLLPLLLCWPLQDWLPHIHDHLSFLFIFVIRVLNLGFCINWTHPPPQFSTGSWDASWRASNILPFVWCWGKVGNEPGLLPGPDGSGPGWSIGSFLPACGPQVLGSIPAAFLGQPWSSFSWPASLVVEKILSQLLSFLLFPKMNGLSK